MERKWSLQAIFWHKNERLSLNRLFFFFRFLIIIFKVNLGIDLTRFSGLSCTLGWYIQLTFNNLIMKTNQPTRKISKTRREFLKTGVMATSISLLPGLITANDQNALAGFLSAAADAEDPLLKDGILDVTKAPFLADPKGIKDSTKAIQKAVEYARDNALMCYFPEGTYLISDTISCSNRVRKMETAVYPDAQKSHYMPIQEPIILMGSAKGKRPVLRLAPGAKGFDDPAKPKRAIWIWVQTYFDAPGKDEPIWGQEQGNISFNHLFLNIDIDVRGHAGAIGIRHSGSQGSALMNSKILAEGAFAGMSNCCGQGGGTYNMEVIGGEYGITIDGDSRFPMLNSCTFRGQTKASIKLVSGSSNVPSLFVGCVFEPSSGILADMADANPHPGIHTIDCMIAMKNGSSIFSSNKKENIFMENTFVKGVKSITSEGPEVASPKSWTLVERFSSHTDYGVKLINGKVSGEEIFISKKAEAAPKTETILARHYIDIPVFDRPGAVNVKRFGATGDGKADDTEAFRKAIAQAELVFIPKGEYLLSGTLELKPDTILFSYSRSFTSIGEPSPANSQHTEEPVQPANPFTTSTVDDANASPGLFFMAVRGNVEWRSGKGTWMLTYGRPAFTGNGGGKFCGFGAGGTQWVVEGITQPTAFYALNVERARVNPMSKFVNCSGVRIYYFKIEAGTITNHSYKEFIKNTPSMISGCKDFIIYGYTGNIIEINDKGPMIEIVDSEKTMVTYVKAFRPGNYLHLRERMNGNVIEIPSDKICTLYVRD
jgi:hypothetical protein